jgi:hypothetical protein
LGYGSTVINWEVSSLDGNEVSDPSVNICDGTEEDCLKECETSCRTNNGAEVNDFYCCYFEWALNAA